MVFAAILALDQRGDPADLITVSEELRRRDDLAAIGGAAYLAGLFEEATTAANVEVHAAIVCENAAKRDLRRLGLELQRRAEEPHERAAAIRADLETMTQALASAHGYGAGRFADSAIDAASFGCLDLPVPEPLLRFDRRTLLCAGDGALMFGKAGIGKTALALDLAVAIALGEPWFGISTPEGGVPVGLLELELPEDALQQRLRAVAGRRREMPSNLHIACRPALKGLVDFDTEQDRAALRSWVKIAGLKLVVIDALVRAHGDGEDDEGLKPLLLSLDALGRELGCSFLLLHHERKGSPQNGREQDPLDAARGHSMLTTYPMLCMRVYRQGAVRVLSFPKVTRGPEPEPIYFRLGDGGRPEPSEAPEAAGKAKGRINQARVLTALQAAYDGQGGVPAEKLEASTGLGRSTVLAHLTALVEAGDVVRERDGRHVSYRPLVRASEPGRSDASSESWLQ